MTAGYIFSKHKQQSKSGARKATEDKETGSSFVLENGSESVMLGCCWSPGCQALEGWAAACYLRAGAKWACQGRRSSRSCLSSAFFLTRQPCFRHWNHPRILQPAQPTQLAHNDSIGIRQTPAIGRSRRKSDDIQPTCQRGRSPSILSVACPSAG